QRRRRYMDDEDDEDRARVESDRPLTGTVRSWVAITMVIVILGFAAIGILVDFLYFQELSAGRGNLNNPVGLNVEKIEMLENVRALLAILRLLAYIATVVAFCMWMYAA